MTPPRFLAPLAWISAALTLPLATAAAEPGPGPQAWPERIANVSATEFWKQVEEGGLLPTRRPALPRGGDRVGTLALRGRMTH